MFRRLRDAVLGFFFPITCAQCGSGLPSDDLYRICQSCREKMPRIEGLVCRRCGLPLPDGGAHCFDCRRKGKHYCESVRSVYRYEGVIRDLIHKFKYRGRDYLSLYFGEMLAGTVLAQPYVFGVDLVVPVPLHWFREYRRGYNQAALLARAVAAAAGIECREGLLVRRKMTKPQFRLDRAGRAGNLAGCFAVRDGRQARGRTVLLIDDICTTAATLEECAKVLKKAGAARVFACTLARD